MRFCLVLAPLLLIASPASAQFWGGPSGGGISGGRPVSDRAAAGAPMPDEMGQIRRDIRHGRESGQLSRREARQLRRDADQLGILEARYRRGGLSDAEQAELYTRRQLLRDDVIARRSGQ